MPHVSIQIPVRCRGSRIASLLPIERDEEVFVVGSAKRRGRVRLSLTEEQRSAFIARKNPKSSYLEVKEIVDLLKRGYKKSAYVCYMRLRVAKRKIITRPQYIHLMNSFGRYHGLHATRIVFDDMHRRHKACNYAHNILMKLYADAGHPRKCRDIFDDLSERYLQADAFSFAILIDAHASMGNVDDACNAYDEMMEFEVEPNSYTIDSLMRAHFLQGDYASVIEASSRREEFENVLPTTNTYAMLITAHTAVGQPGRAQEAYEGMLRDFELHIRWKEEEEEKKRANEDILTAIGGGGPESRFLDEDEAKLLNEDEARLLNEDDEAKENEQVFGEDQVGVDDGQLEDDDGDGGEENGRGGQSRRPRPPRPWASTIRLVEDGFVAMLAARKGNPKGLRAVMDDAIASPVSLTAATFVPCLVQLIDAGDLSGAEEVVELMENSGMEDTADILNAKLRTLTALGRLDGIQAIHEKLRKHIKSTDKYTLNLLVDAYRSLGRCEDAIAAVEELRSVGLKANLGTYNILLQIYAEKGDASGAEQLIERMQRRKLRPNTRSFNILMTLYLNLNRAEDVLKTSERMTENLVSLNIQSYNILLRSAKEAGEAEQMNDLILEIERTELEWTAETFVRIADYYLQVADNEALENLCDRLLCIDNLTPEYVKPVLDLFKTYEGTHFKRYLTTAIREEQSHNTALIASIDQCESG